MPGRLCYCSIIFIDQIGSQKQLLLLVMTEFRFTSFTVICCVPLMKFFWLNQSHLPRNKRKHTVILDFKYLMINFSDNF